MFRTLAIVLLVSAPAYALPDLVVNTALEFKLPSGSTDLRNLRAGEAITVKGRIRNAGIRTAVGTVVDVSVNGARVGSQAFLTLRPNHDAAFSIRWVPVSAGRQEITVVADPMNLVAESNEANNSAAVILNLAAFDTRVMPAPNTDTRATDTRIIEGQANLAISGDLKIHGTPRVDRGGSTLRFTVVNNGSIRAKNVEVEIRVNGDYKMTRNIGTLNAHSSRKVSINWKPEFSGSQVIQVVVDPAMHVLETSEVDNSAVMTVNVTGSKKKNDRRNNDRRNDDGAATDDDDNDND